jgi:hypothetical protein
MAKLTKRDSTEAKERLREALKDCAPGKGASLEIRWTGGRPTSPGSTYRYGLNVWRIGDDGSPFCAEWLTWNAACACGWRFNESHESLSLGGSEYPKTKEIAQCMADIAGHPIRVECPGTSFGASRVVEPSRRAKSA